VLDLHDNAFGRVGFEEIDADVTNAIAEIEAYVNFIVVDREDIVYVAAPNVDVANAVIQLGLKRPGWADAIGVMNAVQDSCVPGSVSSDNFALSGNWDIQLSGDTAVAGAAVIGSPFSTPPIPTSADQVPSVSHRVNKLSSPPR
jgi:hypothetical protein